MKITPENSTALIIDLQEKIVPAIADAERLLARSRFLLDGLAVFDVPVVSTRQYPKGLGETLPEIADGMKKATVFDKTTFSCLATDEIRAAFIADPRPNVVLAGIEAHICVLQTALDLLELGKTVYWVADCVSSRNPFDAQIAFERAVQAGVVPTTAESLLFELTGAAGSPQFKQISKLATGRR